MKIAITSETLVEFQALCKKLDKKGYKWPNGVPLFNIYSNESEYNRGIRVIVLEDGSDRVKPAAKVNGLKKSKIKVTIIKSQDYN